jgi:hypothetical protein
MSLMTKEDQSIAVGVPKLGILPNLVPWLRSPAASDPSLELRSLGNWRKLALRRSRSCKFRLWCWGLLISRLGWGMILLSAIKIV